VADQVFANMVDIKQYVKSVVVPDFANTANQNHDAKNVVDHNYVKQTIVKQEVLQNIMDIAYLVAFKYVLKFKYRTTIKQKKEM
jgi:hypothetical protein